jgi:hypothetical protein
MSSALAIASVTAVLRDLLHNGLIDQDVSANIGGDVKVTALPPDRITTGDHEQSQINLFLYQVTPNAGWRNFGLPSRDGRGESIAAPPLALDLHYLLSAYGAQDFHAEILLGYAMQLLHETPVLGRDAIRTALGATTLVDATDGLPATLAALSTSALADQVEQIKIAPQTLNTEETSKLWTALQARYRAAAAYHVSVVLIDSRQRVRAALPVLRRGEEDRGVDAHASAALPNITRLRLPHSQSSALVGDEIRLQIENGAGFSAVRFSHNRSQVSFEIPSAGIATVEDDLGLPELAVPVAQPVISPTGSVLPPWFAGNYAVALVVDQGTKRFTSNEVIFSLAPRILAVPQDPLTADGDGNATLTITCTPPVRLVRVDDTSTRFDQQVELLLGGRFGRPLVPEPPAANAGPPAPQPLGLETLVFVFPIVPADAGDYLPRLRIDGVEMPAVDWKKTPPEFDWSHKVTIA